MDAQYKRLETGTTIMFKIFKQISEWFLFPNSYLLYIKYKNFILIPNVEFFSVNGVLLGTTFNIWY